MSIPNLPVNFKDDILAASNAKRKYQQTFNSDGSVSLEDVTVYTQKGSDFGASQVNQTNGAVNNIYDERILDLEELELVTEPGFFVDAQAAKEAYDELNGKLQAVPKVKSGLITLEYYSSTWLYAQLSVGAEFNGCTPVCCQRYASGATGGILQVETVQNGVANIWASGSGFVSGHLMSVSWVISTD